MLTIRDVQLAALRGPYEAHFEDRLFDRLAELRPKHLAALGEAGAREFIRRTMAAGQSHRIHSQGALTIYIDLVIDFGERFERAPDRAWAWKILAHPKLPDHIRVDVVRRKFESRTGGRILVPQGGSA